MHLNQPVLNIKQFKKIKKYSAKFCASFSTCLTGCLPISECWVKWGIFPKSIYIYPIDFLFEVRKMADLPIAAVVRIAKKNGAERVGSDAAEALVVKAEKYIAALTKEANKLAEHAGRKTIKKEDVDLASKS